MYSFLPDVREDLLKRIIKTSSWQLVSWNKIFLSIFSCSRVLQGSLSASAYLQLTDTGFEFLLVACYQLFFFHLTVILSLLS